MTRSVRITCLARSSVLTLRSFPTTEAVLFADLAGFTALTSAHGDDFAAEVASRLFELTDEVRTAGAVLVKTIGDAVMLADEHAGDLVDIALGLHRRIEAEPGYPALRVGLAFGPVVVRDDDRFGTTVNIAARVAAYARSGQVLATEAAAEAAGVKDTSTALGPVQLRGLLEAVRLVDLTPEVQERDDAVDPVCRMRVPVPSPATLPYNGRTWHFCSFACAQRFAEDPDGFLNL
jgi:class 3 adenylate cyclase/YHS domain-containing protein